MRSSTTTAVSIGLLFSINASALEVTVINPVLSGCGYPTGILQALIFGGVPPYTILWSTGATTDVVTGLTPGTYSVTVIDAVATEVSAQGDVLSQSLMQGGQTVTNLAHCPGGYPYADLTFYNFQPGDAPVWGPGPFTITGPASVVSSSTLPCVNCSNMASLVRVEMNVPPGSIQTITWTNGFGCPGESMVIMSTEAVWPQVMVTDVQGACANGANGGFNITINGGSQFFTAKLYRPNGSLLNVLPVNGPPSVQGHGLLAPGNYQLHLITESYGPTNDEQCADMTTITVPDLGASCGNVNGRVFVDGNANCLWTFNENSIRQAIVEFTPGPYYASTNSQGLYSANLPLGTYDHSVMHPAAQQECPGPFTLSVAQGLVNEPIGCSSLFPLDVQVTMANGPARPGFDLTYGLNLRNNTVANAGASTLTLVFDAELIFNSATPTPTSVVGNTVTWALNGVGAYASSNYLVRLTVPPDVGLIGTTLNSTATISTANTDAFLANNTWSSAQLITGSIDPNNKIAQTSSRLSDALYFIDVDQYIDYTLNFQNTGSDTAFLVVVTDTLPATLDPASVQVGAASHPFTWGLAGTGVLTFNFVNIQLPDSNVNEGASHGFVSFRIKPRQPVLAGTVIENVANIFFDYNDPVITEPSVLTAEFSTHVPDPQQQFLLVHPNPTTGILNVQFPEGVLDPTLRVHASDGRLVLVHRGSGRSTMVDLGGLPSGIYALEVLGAPGLTTRFLINY